MMTPEINPAQSGQGKLLRVARTIADFEGQEDIKRQFIADAAGYRSLDGSVWA